jgi:hypothetical protein
MAAITSRPMLQAIKQTTQDQKQQARVNAQKTSLERQESDLAARTSSSMMARRGRGAGRAMLLGTDEQQSTLG